MKVALLVQFEPLLSLLAAQAGLFEANHDRFPKRPTAFPAQRFIEESMGMLALIVVYMYVKYVKVVYIYLHH